MRSQVRATMIPHYSAGMHFKFEDPDAHPSAPSVAELRHSHHHYTDVSVLRTVYFMTSSPSLPGYVIAPDMTSAKLFVTSPKGLTLSTMKVSNPSIMVATILKVVTATAKNGTTADTSTANGTAPIQIDVVGVSRGRARLTLVFSDGSENQVHYSVLPSLKDQVAAVGTHWAEDAWLPREYVPTLRPPSLPPPRTALFFVYFGLVDPRGHFTY